MEEFMKVCEKGCSENPRDTRYVKLGYLAMSARNKKLPKETIELNNGWRMVEASRGKHTTSDMLTYYTELSLSIASLVPFLFSSVL